MVKDNKLISQKSFGKLSYDENSRAVDNSTIYDIASITKVLSVTPIAMKLIDQRKLSLEHTLEQYYPSLYGKPNGKITIKHLLTHSSGLKPFIEFYKKDSELIDKVAEIYKEDVERYGYDFSDLENAQ